MKNQVKVLSEENIFVTALKRVLAAMLFTAVSLLLLTLFMAYGNMADNVSAACVRAAAFICVFAAGFFTAGKRSRAGWFSGLVAGVIYILITIIAGFLIFGDFVISGETVKMLLLSVFGSVVGGIFGVNIKRKRK